MTFNRIDLEQWERKEYFNHYFNQQTSFSMTRDIDISLFREGIKRQGYKFYPALIYIITNVVNANKAFRTGFNSEGQLGYWEKLEPLYTIFNEQSESFSNLWTETTSSFECFYKNFESDLNQYSTLGGIFPKTPIPENTIPISMIPWSTFSAFNLNINNNSNFLLPIVTAGKFYLKKDTTYLPVSLQVHHAVCDGYHAALFMNQLQDLANHLNKWL